MLAEGEERAEGDCSSARRKLHRVACESRALLDSIHTCMSTCHKNATYTVPLEETLPALPYPISSGLHMCNTYT